MPAKRKLVETAMPEEEEAVEPVDWASLTVSELKVILNSRGLPKTGRKADLVARLEESDNGEVNHAELEDEDLPPPETPKKLKKAKKQVSPDIEVEGPLAADVMENQNRNAMGEKRLKPFVPAPDDSYKTKLKKIQRERMFMLDRKKSVDNAGYVCEIFDIAGSTGNIYQTTIGRVPNCKCMDAIMRGQKCKHINYALIIILKAPSHLCYQRAFLSDELDSIFANAPVTRAPDAAAHKHDEEPSEEEMFLGNRKPIDGECPICVFDMEPNEDIIWCKNSCGQNFHRECFAQWKRSKGGGRVTCVYCRAEWQEDGEPARSRPVPGSLASLKESAPKIGSYQNIGHHPMYHQNG